jgi:hypothetical protein
MNAEYPHTVSGLIEKRREIAGKIEHTQRELHNLVVMLDHLDFTIRIFDPDAPAPVRRIEGLAVETLAGPVGARAVGEAVT